MEGSIIALIIMILAIISHIIKSIREAAETVKQQQLQKQQQQNKQDALELIDEDPDIIDIVRPRPNKQPAAKTRPDGRQPLSRPLSKPIAPLSSSAPLSKSTGAKSTGAKSVGSKSAGAKSTGSLTSRPQALSKKLSPQGEGHRFYADPGTLNVSQIVTPSIDPTVKPDLYSITGIYEEGALFADRSQPAISINLADTLAQPNGIIQAVILAEIFNKPAWLDNNRLDQNRLDQKASTP